MRYLCSMGSCARVWLLVLLWFSCPLVTTSVAAQDNADCQVSSYECAVGQVQRHEFAAAVGTLERLLAQSPKDLKTLNLLGIALTGAGKPADANIRFRAALAIDPRFSPALRNLAVNEFTMGQPDARRHFEDVLRQSPDDEIAHQHLGEIYFEKKQYRLALTHYDKSRARVVQSATLILHNATCLLEERRTKDAIALLDRLPAADPASWFEGGVVLGRYGAHAEAARFFGAARRNGYKDVYTAGYNQTLMLIDAGNYDGAIGVAQELFDQGLRKAELYSLVSRAYAKTNRIKEAYDALRAATRIEPSAAEHYIDLAMLCLEHENYELALEIVDIGLTNRPESSMLHLQRGVVLAMSGSIEQAQEAFARASRAAPDDPSPSVALAMVWMQRGQTPKAVELLRARTRAATSQTPRQAVLFYALGIALLRAGAAPDDAAGSEALDAFRTAVRLQPSLPQAQSELGKLMLKRGDIPGAIAHLEQAIALEPQNAAPAYVLAQAYRRLGQTDRARDLLARVSRLNAQERGDDPQGDLRPMMFRIVRDSGSPSPPVSPPSAIDAAACAAAGDLDGAIVRLREAVAAAPGNADARYQLSVTLWNRYQRAAGRRQKSDLDEAVAALTPAVAQHPDRPQFHLVLGQLRAEQQQFPQAIEHLRRAAALDPGSADYPYNLGLALRLDGNLEGAGEQFRAALAKNPGHTLARRSLGLVLRQQGDVKGASVELRRAATELPEDAQGRYLLGTVLVKLGDTAGAISELREAVRLEPSLTEARVILAQALVKTGQNEDALLQQAEVRRINEREGRLRPHARAARFLGRARRERRSRGCDRAASRGGRDFSRVCRCALRARNPARRGARARRRSGKRVSPRHRTRSGPRARLPRARGIARAPRRRGGRPRRQSPRSCRRSVFVTQRAQTEPAPRAGTESSQLRYEVHGRATALGIDRP